MTSYAKPIPFLFLIFFCFSLHIQARESKFFSKVTHNNVIGSKTPIFKTPTPAPAPAPESANTLSENGYGLYGHDDSSEFPTTAPPTTTTTTVTTTNEENEELENRKYETSYANNNYYYNNNENPSGNYHGYTNNNNNYYTNGYEDEKQGMSDTRFLENGRYYYGTRNGESNGNYNGYEPARRGSTRDEGYKYNGNNNVNSNEFNTMEEYYQSQHEYQDNQAGYEP